MRCFIAIELPKEIRDILYTVQKEIGGKYAKIKWVFPKNLHLTLKFLGDLDEEDVGIVKKSLRGIKLKGFSVSLGELGWFPNDQRINVLWVGLKPEKEILGLHGDVELKLSGLVEKDDRFSVHLTLGRVKLVKNKEKFLALLKKTKIPWDNFYVKTFSLMKSDLSKDGPQYSILERYDLG